MTFFCWNYFNFNSRNFHFKISCTNLFSHGKGLTSWLMGFSWTTRRERVHLHNSVLQGTIQGRKERRFARIAWIELKKNAVLCNFCLRCIMKFFMNARSYSFRILGFEPKFLSNKESRIVPGLRWQGPKVKESNRKSL